MSCYVIAMALTVATIETAIETLLSGGQSVTVDGMTYTQASLSGLIQLREKLKHEADRATRPTVRALEFGSMGY